MNVDHCNHRSILYSTQLLRALSSVLRHNDAHISFLYPGSHVCAAVYGNIAFTVNEFKCIQRARLTLDMATLKYATVPHGKILPLPDRDSHFVKITQSQ